MSKTISERFWAKTDRAGNCWLWTGSMDSCGYGMFKFDGSMRGAHRWAWQDANGPIPDGLEIDHLCRVRNCVNPDHMECVSHAENVRRGDVGSLNRRKTHCPQGHPYSGANLGMSNAGRRQCLRCLRAQSVQFAKDNPEKCRAYARRYRERNRDALRAKALERYYRNHR